MNDEDLKFWTASIVMLAVLACVFIGITAGAYHLLYSPTEYSVEDTATTEGQRIISGVSMMDNPTTIAAKSTINANLSQESTTAGPNRVTNVYYLNEGGEQVDTRNIEIGDREVGSAYLDKFGDTVYIVAVNQDGEVVSRVRIDVQTAPERGGE